VQPWHRAGSTSRHTAGASADAVSSRTGGGPGAAPRSGRSRITGARNREGGVRTFPWACSRPAVTSTVARRRRSVKEPSERAHPRALNPRSGSTIRCAPGSTLARGARRTPVSRGKAPRKATLTAAGRRRPELPQGREHSDSGPRHPRGFEPTSASPSVSDWALVPRRPGEGRQPPFALPRTADTGRVAATNRAALCPRSSDESGEQSPVLAPVRQKTPRFSPARSQECNLAWHLSAQPCGLRALRASLLPGPVVPI
jgi:hypothetical protein